MNVNKGFNLVELMVVMAILGILAAIAIPSYSSSIEKGRRADGKVALAGALALQERQFSLTHQYTDDISMLGGETSAEGFYAMSVAYISTLGACTANKDCYTLTATAIGAQTNDTSCAELTVNNLGQKMLFLLMAPAMTETTTQPQAHLSPTPLVQVGNVTTFGACSAGDGKQARSIGLA